MEERDDVSMLHESRSSRRRLGEVGDHADDRVAPAPIRLRPAGNETPHCSVTVPVFPVSYISRDQRGRKALVLAREEIEMHVAQELAIHSVLPSIPNRVHLRICPIASAYPPLQAETEDAPSCHVDPPASSVRGTL